jgi:hypothetical protein
MGWEAGLRAERRASGAKILMAEAMLPGGLERSDKTKKTR